MSPGRKPPHCKTCHRPLKGHKRGVCELTGLPSFITSVPPLPGSASEKTQQFTPLEVLPILSPQSCQILNELLRVNSYCASSVLIPEIQRRTSGCNIKHGESQHEAFNSISTNITTNDGENPRKSYTAGTPQGTEGLPEADSKRSVPGVIIRTTVMPSSSSRVVSQQLSIVKTPSRKCALDPLEVTVSQRLQLEDLTSLPQQDRQQSPPSDVPNLATTFQDFFANMSRDPQLPPATIFSFPASGIISLEDTVTRRGLCMHVLSLPDPGNKWIPVIVGRNTDAITKLLEDGEKLAQDFKKPDKFQNYDFHLGMNHVLVGALGALAMWAGLAYS